MLKLHSWRYYLKPKIVKYPNRLNLAGATKLLNMSKCLNRLDLVTATKMSNMSKCSNRLFLKFKFMVKDRVRRRVKVRRVRM